jgi:hypothetical protein
MTPAAPERPQAANGRSRRVRSRLNEWFLSLDRVELIATTVLALAAIATAWSAFQSAKWSGEQAILFSEASAARTESTRASTTAGQLVQIDVGMFVDWLGALDSDNRSGAIDLVAGVPYVADPGTLSGVLFERFREEFVPAVEAWLATEPLVNDDAPKSPFDMDEYTLESAVRADALLGEAEEKATAARTANQTSDNYVLTGVLFALVLFFAGVSSKLERARNRSIMMVLAISGLIAGFITVLLLPIQAPF